MNSSDKNIYTIDDIARELGVSKTTVSRAISGKGRISAQTRSKIRAFIEEHNYRPNAVAKGLAQSRTFNLGFILPDNYMTNDFSFFQQCLMGICDAASDEDYDILLAISGQNNTRQLERIIDNHKVDGIIVSRSIMDSDDIAVIKSKGIPFILVGYSPESDILYIDNDNLSACRDLTALLITRGIRRPALLGGNDTHYVTHSRLHGYEEALQQCGLDIHNELIFLNTDNSTNISKAIDEILLQQADCILCMDDLICNLALLQLNDRGIRIPQDIQIASFYDSTILQHNIPPVTSLKFDARTLGAAACKRLLEKLSGYEITSSMLSGYQIIFRESTR